MVDLLIGVVVLIILIRAFRRNWQSFKDAHERKYEVCAIEFHPEHVDDEEDFTNTLHCLDFVSADEYHVDTDFLLNKVAISREPISIHYSKADNPSNLNPSNTSTFLHNYHLSDLVDILDKMYVFNNGKEMTLLMKAEEIQEILEGVLSIEDLEGAVTAAFSGLRLRTASRQELYFAFIDEKESKW